MGWYAIDKAAFAIVVLLCFYLFTDLFYKLATVDIETTTVLTPYYSDLPAHIISAMAGETYSLMGIITKAIYTLPYDVASIFLAIIISLMELLSVYSLYLLFLEMDKVVGYKTKTVDRAVYQWLSLVSLFFVSICIPGLLPSYYIHNFSMVCWHNDTYIAMRPFSILVVVFFIRIIVNVGTYLDRKDLLLFCLFLFISTWMKPNFFIGFIILILVVAIWCLIKNNQKTTIFKHLIIMAICTLPAVLCLLLQNEMVYGSSTNGDGIIFAPMQLVNKYIINWEASLTIFLAFPLVVLLYECKKLRSKSFAYLMIWMLWGSLYFIGFFLAESGPRMNHFNFAWGMIFAAGLLYACTYYMWYSRIRIHIFNKDPVLERHHMLSRGITLAYCLVGGLLLMYLAYVGIEYFTLIYTGAENYRL